MKNITKLFSEIYLPEKALLVYRSMSRSDECYIESYDIGADGSPINAHPLSLTEMTVLAECLNSATERSTNFLNSTGLLPEQVLHINTTQGYALWYTPAQTADLLYTQDLSIPSGTASVPSLLWKADRKQLHLYALKTGKRPTLKTAVYHAPFFNMYENGAVCMGTVDIDISRACTLEDFIDQWQQYFFNSYFSHLLQEYTPVSCNIVQLWQEQITTGRKFPNDVLKKSNITLKQLIQ